MMDMERRTFDIELRVVRADDEAPKIVGHAAVFNELSEDLGGFREQIAAGAFKRAIKRDDVRALWNHDPNHVLGRNKAGTLRMAEDEKGLAIEIDPPDTQTARDLLVSMDRGDVTQMSFGFQVEKQTWDEPTEENQLAIRTLNRVALFDVSPVTYPAYPQTDVAVREFRAWLDEGKQDEYKSVPLSLLEKELDLIS